MPFPITQQVNLPTCSHYCPFNAERQAGKLWKPILKSLLRLEIKPKSTAPARRTLYTTRPSELLSLLSLELLNLHYASFPIFVLFSNDSGFPSVPSFLISVFNSARCRFNISVLQRNFFWLFPLVPSFPISVFYQDFCHFRLSVFSDISAF